MSKVCLSFAIMKTLELAWPPQVPAQPDYYTSMTRECSKEHLVKLQNALLCYPFE